MEAEMEGFGHKPRNGGSHQKLEEAGMVLPQKLQRELVFSASQFMVTLVRVAPGH